jgi:hypothetical protein
MARQLRHAVEALPDKLTRAEAWYLFRTALLSLQTALVVKPGASQQYLQPLGRHSEANGRGSATLSNGPEGELQRKALEAGMEAQKFSMLRKTTKGEDLATMALCPKLPPPVPPVLPARQEMEMESEQLRALSEQIMASNREELNVVRLLEEELRANRAAKTASSGSKTHVGPRSDMEVKSEVAEEEISRLEAELKARGTELKSFETEVAGQQREINALLAARLQEEVAADEAGREARDIAAELKTCKRTCGSLESEIASEEVRATALREAFEGRRARFATAETAARNAELSTMRATRRRVAAESAVHREEEAVEEARFERINAAATSSNKVEALECEIAEVRRRVENSQTSGNSGGNMAGRLSTTANRASTAEASLQETRAELAAVQREHEKEVAIEEISANETAQLEIAQARIQEQLNLRRSETDASSSKPVANGGPADNEQRELELTAQAIRLVEERVAEMRHREAQVQQEVREAEIAQSESSDVLWQRACEVACELGDAQAALVRRRAQEQSPSSDAVVAVLREALQDTEAQEARNSEELAELSRNHSQPAARGRTSKTRLRTNSGHDPNSPLRSILQHIESLRSQAASAQQSSGSNTFERQSSGSQNDGTVQKLQSEVKSLETALDDKEEVILKLARLSSKLDAVHAT